VTGGMACQRTDEIIDTYFLAGGVCGGVPHRKISRESNQRINRVTTQLRINRELVQTTGSNIDAITDRHIEWFSETNVIVVVEGIKSVYP
jgi:phospholipid N-methyltransferase